MAVLKETPKRRRLNDDDDDALVEPVGQYGGHDGRVVEDTEETLEDEDDDDDDTDMGPGPQPYRQSGPRRANGQRPRTKAQLMAAARQAGVDPRTYMRENSVVMWTKDKLPPTMENELEFIIKDPRSFKQGKSLHSPIVEMAGGFRFRLLIFPQGTESTGKLEGMAAFVEAVPDDSFKDERWAFEAVKYQINVVNWKDYRKTVTQSDGFSFRFDATDRGWHRGLLRNDLMTTELGWLNEDSELCLRASCSSRRAMLHLPAVGSLYSQGDGLAALWG